MFKAACLGLVAALILSTVSATPAPVSRTKLSLTLEDRVLVHRLLEWAVANSNGKYKMPAVEPIVLRLSPYAMAEIACPGHLTCPVYGLHHVGSYVVMVLGVLPVEDQEHAIPHESIHYLQSRPDPSIHDCMTDFRDEMEAYRLQFKYRMIVQDYKGPAPTVSPSCAPDELK